MSASKESTPFNLEQLEKLSRSTRKMKKTPFPSPQTSERGSARKSTAPASTALAKTEKRASRANALQQYEDLVGGRTAIADILSSAPTLDKKERYFLQLVSDPSHNEDSILLLSREAGLDPAKALDLFRSASFAKAHVLALGRLTEALPDTAGDIAAKCVDSEIPCPTCRGHLVSGFFCDTCKDTGKVFRESTLDHQKLLLETLGILKKSGLQIQMNQNSGNTIQTGSFFSKYVRDSDTAAYDIDVEAVPVKESDDPNT